MSLLRVENLSKVFGGVHAVEDLSFTVNAGTVHSVIGPNGAGKTTLFNLVTGVYTPSSGRVLFEDQPVSGKPPHVLARLGMSRTFQNLQICMNLTAVENVMVGRHLHLDRRLLPALFRLPKITRGDVECREKAAELMRFVGTGKYVGAEAASMPYGALKRLEIARALAAEPRMLLLDEPAAGLNANETGEIDELIQRVAETGVTVVLVEHDMKLVMNISDHILVLDYGKKLAEGSAVRGLVRRGGQAMTRTPDKREALSLRPMTRGMRAFAMMMFFVLGLATAAFLLLNPFDLPFLPRPQTEHVEAEESASTEPQQLYQCPMHPEVIEQTQGDCPICLMKLMPMQETAAMDESGGAGEEGDAAGVIRIDPVQVQNTGVVSESARLGAIGRTVHTVGILDYNADDITWINTKFSGWIEKVHVAYMGQEVRRGDPLFDIYSPELVTTQEEYLRALDYRESLESSERQGAMRQAESLLRSTRDRLVYWDISEEQIRALETRRTTQRRLTIASPADGVVTEIMDQALEGIFVNAGMNLYKIADLSTVWVHADVYETDLPWVREDQPAEVSFRHDPDRVVRGQILFLYPEVSKETRTLKICVEVPNRDRRLRPGMYADVIIHGPPVHDAVLIPSSAVLRSGERDLVFVDLGDGRFEPREVTLGIEGGQGQVQILRGVVAGEAVVTQAQFMLDSESRVQEAIAKFAKRGTSGPAPVHDHGGH